MKVPLGLLLMSSAHRSAVSPHPCIPCILFCLQRFCLACDNPRSRRNFL
nr:MAG TPA: hypothetical protein [Inoviridae sp.]